MLPNFTSLTHSYNIYFSLQKQKVNLMERDPSNILKAWNMLKIYNKQKQHEQYYL